VACGAGGRASYPGCNGPHEDHPQRALYAAMRMQKEMRRYAERLRANKGVNFQARVGINIRSGRLRRSSGDNAYIAPTQLNEPCQQIPKSA